ncbi:Flp family type IVb pilin [Actibacterium sp. XHP0104]|uniref:Flp family type IVb pilin n=1 Tax=Actibacterium sp. XHP0104 TaxID=2984335 RepID=UPI0021E7F5A7|nr:hypothetical protein [Actibacterium sp. XHP0104]MCV2882967.1 hypothetical protein [Actibacterium sp. XHP0104]
MTFNKIKTFIKDESGAAMVEYAVALLVVTGIGIGAMATIGENAGGLVGTACTGLETAASAGAGTC